MEKLYNLRKPTFNYCQNHPLSSLLYHLYASDDVHRKHCPNVPTVVIHQREPDAHGHRGKMSLCDDCLTLIKKIARYDLFTVEPISMFQQLKAQGRQDRLRRHLTLKQAKAEAAGVVLVPAVGPDLRLSGDYAKTSPRPPSRPLTPQDPLDKLAALLVDEDPYAKMRDDV